MKIQKKIILDSFKRLSQSTNNKFWGLLSIFKTINDIYGEIEPNKTYKIETSSISEILDNWFYYGDEMKNYNRNDIFIHFSKNWIDVFNKVTSKGKPNILDIAIFYYKNEEFENVSSLELVNLLKKTFKLSDSFINSNFDLEYSNHSLILEKTYSKKEFINYFKKEYSLKTNYETLSFSSPFLIVSKPSELKRAPFIQTLYSGTEVMELLIIADFDINEYYFYSNNTRKNSPIILENKVLYKIIFESFKYVCEKYGAELVLKDYQIKNANIEERNFNGIVLNKYFGFEVFIGVFDKNQSEKDLQSGNTPRFVSEKIKVLNYNNAYFTNQWNAIENGRGLTLSNFNAFLSDISNNNLEIIRNNGVYKLIEKLNFELLSPLKETKQVIFYGAPGTGKSYKVDNEIKHLDPKFYERITFHPEFDHASFVGSYKPKSEKNEIGKDVIKYQFVPQAFTDIYVRAWIDQNNQYYLVIEEINRGNCAEIFGDIFQLLDRNSKYTVTPSNEIKEYLIQEFGDTKHQGIVDGLKLPPNLSILATMNTSDQSLFPMDSAFKRRWDWEYIPICYDDIPENESFGYEVIIDEKHSFKWIDFIKNINAVIKSNPNLGMDKCIGNYFIKSNSKEITLKEFINKAIFYLWNDVFKDEDSSDSIFDKGISYEDFFPIETNGKEEVKKILNDLDIKTFVKVNL